MTKKEIQFWKKAIKLLEDGYGCNCKISDLDDFPEMWKKGKLSRNIRHEGRCASCRARETVDFIKFNLRLQ